MESPLKEMGNPVGGAGFRQNMLGFVIDMINLRSVLDFQVET